MNDLIIVGAGDVGREIFDVLLTAPSADWVVKGFIDDNLKALENYNYSVPILDTINNYLPRKNDVFICAIAKPKIKLEISKSLEMRGAVFITFVHPSAFIIPNTKIGKGCVIFPNAVISSNTILGDFVHVNFNSLIGHDNLISDGTTISSLCDLTGFVSIGKSVFIGSHVSVLPKVKIGDGATVGAGSLVTRTVKAGTTVIGVPAKQFI